jgi:hypothetical protein
MYLRFLSVVLSVVSVGGVGIASGMLLSGEESISDRYLLRMHDGTHPIHMHTHCSPLQVGVCSDSADAAHMRRTGGGCAW